MAKIRANKPEAARRQIDAAIEMLFAQKDLLPIMTLAQAGFRVLKDLCAHRGVKETSVMAMLDAVLIPEKKKEFWARIYGPGNFLKHADKDPDEILDNVEDTACDYTLFLSCTMYADLGFQLTPQMNAFMSWMSAIHPDYIADGHPIKGMLKDLDWLRSEDRASQLKYGQSFLDMAKAHAINPTS